VVERPTRVTVTFTVDDAPGVTPVTVNTLVVELTPVTIVTTPVLPVAISKA
jgi:hypothetical protein